MKTSWTLVYDWDEICRYFELNWTVINCKSSATEAIIVVEMT